MLLPSAGGSGAVVTLVKRGISAPFRAGLSARGLRRAVGTPRTLKVHPADVALVAPPAASRRKLHEPNGPSRPAEGALADAPWRG